MKLLLNAIQCKVCKEVIASRSVHDFRYCKCKSVAVDGGLEYRRRLGSNYTECCAFAYGDNERGRSDQGEFIGKFLVWSPGGKTNPSVAFDRQEDAVASAKEMAARIPGADWYVAILAPVT